MHVRWLSVALCVAGCAEAGGAGADVDAAPGSPDAPTTMTPDAAAPVLAEYAFQDGVAPTPGYAGTTDTTIAANTPSAAAGSRSSLQMDGNEPNASFKDVHALIRWDLSAVPKGARVKAAHIVFDMTDGDDGLTPEYQAFAVRRAWDESVTTWEKAEALQLWQAAGAVGDMDRDSVPLADVAAVPKTRDLPAAVTVELNAAGVVAVQGWLDTPASNFGLIFIGDANLDGVQVGSREATDATKRPRLVLQMSQ